MVVSSVLAALLFVFFVPAFFYALGVRSGKRSQLEQSGQTQVVVKNKKINLWVCPRCEQAFGFTDQFDLDRTMFAHHREDHT